MSQVVTQVLAALFVVLLLVALVAAIVIASRQRRSTVAASGQAQHAGELIKLEDELNYADAFADPGTVQAANIAKARNELNAAFALYTSAANQTGAGTAATDTAAIQAHISRVKQLLAAGNKDIGGGAFATRTTAIPVNSEISPVLGPGAKVFEIALWVLGIVPGAILAWQKAKARSYFATLDQRIKTAAAQIDVYLERRAEILAGAIPLVGANALLAEQPATGSSSPNMPNLLANPPGIIGNSTMPNANAQRNYTSGQLDRAYQQLVQQTHQSQSPPPQVISALRANRGVEREITAARTLYNDMVSMWNSDIFLWPAKMMVASEDHLTTRPLFVTSEIARSLDSVGTL